MPVIVDRLGQLRRLRERVDAEIRLLERREAARERSRALTRRRHELEEAPPAVVRAWAREQGIPVAARGRVSDELRRAYLAHIPTPGGAQRG